MGRKKDLSEDGKHETNLYFVKTVKIFVSVSEHRITQSDKGLLGKVSVKRINCIKRTAVKRPLSSKQVFEASGISGFSKTSPKTR